MTAEILIDFGQCKRDGRGPVAVKDAAERHAVVTPSPRLLFSRTTL